MTPQISAAIESLPAIDRAALAALVATVLHVPVEKVTPEADLVAHLGAESIDFLDLIFGLEGLVGHQVLPDQWTQHVRSRITDFSKGGITVALLEEFAALQAAAGTPEPQP